MGCRATNRAQAPSKHSEVQRLHVLVIHEREAIGKHVLGIITNLVFLLIIEMTMDLVVSINIVLDMLSIVNLAFLLLLLRERVSVQDRLCCGRVVSISCLLSDFHGLSDIGSIVMVALNPCDFSLNLGAFDLCRVVPVVGVLVCLWVAIWVLVVDW